MTTKDVFPALLELPWIVFVIYWMMGAIRTRATRRKESLASRYGILLLEVAGLALVFVDGTGVGFLGARFMPRTLAQAILGAALTWLGIGLAIWARYHLAEYWSARITIKQDHQLIRTGPYAHLRHPIYSGIILATIGSSLVIDKWRCPLGVCLVLTGYWVKAKREETMLSQQFGEAFSEHQKHAGFLIPRFR
jgi:protein-S-isoprenylcysteine O-methyltransferase Ste14